MKHYQKAKKKNAATISRKRMIEEKRENERLSEVERENWCERLLGMKSMRRCGVKFWIRYGRCMKEVKQRRWEEGR